MSKKVIMANSKASSIRNVIKRIGVTKKEVSEMSIEEILHMLCNNKSIIGITPINDIIEIIEYIKEGGDYEELSLEEDIAWIIDTHDVTNVDLTEIKILI